MIFNAFEPEVHVLAIQNYLESQSNGTARPEDLWRSFDLYAAISFDGIRNVSCAEVMATWTDQPGYPVVNAILRNYKLTLTQVILNAKFYRLTQRCFNFNINSSIASHRRSGS